MPGVHNGLGGTMAPPLDNNITVPATVASQAPGYNNHHRQHSERLFIGPMLFTAAEGHLGPKDSGGFIKHWFPRRHDMTSSDNINEEISERHAFQYFLRRGGTEQDWESQESVRQRVKREILHHWRQSGWSSIHFRKKENGMERKWVGATFKIGEDFLGLSIHTNIETVRSISSHLVQPAPSTSRISEPFSRTLSAQTYHTAPEGPSNMPPSSHSSSIEVNTRGSKSSGSNVALLPSLGHSAHHNAAVFPSFLASISFPARALTDTQVPHADVPVACGNKSSHSHSQKDVSGTSAAIPFRPALHHSRQDASKSVQFSTVPPSQLEPASPSEVLTRRPSNAPDTSAGAAATQMPGRAINTEGESFEYGDVVRRAHMLVRRCNVKSGNISMYFDEEEAIKLRHLRSYEWKEFMVIWRERRLELYEDYTIPGKEALLGHKHLACVIPLQKPNTHLSLYSFVDLSFCLTCTMIHVSKDKMRTMSDLNARKLFHRTIGTDIFIFKTRSRTLAIDWMWELWRQLGNEIPQTFEVHCPSLQARVKLSIPEYDSLLGEGYKIFTKDYVVNICQKALGTSPSWDHFVKEPMRRGAQLELCWRKGSMLDWIRWEHEINGRRRDWAVLYGLCLGKPREITHLEIRIGEHRPTTVTLEDGTRLTEPPAVEGYVYRIKPNSQTRTQVYISTHGGCLFLCHPSRAHPPRPPIPMNNDLIPSEIYVEEDNNQEIRRGAQQVLQADAFIDLRSIAAVRRAFQRVFRPIDTSHDPLDRDDFCSSSLNTVRQADGEDEGGDEALAQQTDKLILKMRRSFELLMKTGNVVRFETYSCKVAQEWVEYLSPLIEYWNLRHRVDATHEMELIRAITGSPSPNVTRPGQHIVPEQLPDLDKASGYLPSFWSWCVVDGCLSVIRNGRLFLRGNLRGQYKLMQLMLVSGHLVQFHIASHRTTHHMRSRVISLSDAYVCSGHFATQSLPIHEFAKTREPLRRRFQDGLESEDLESDTVFLLWYRPGAVEDMDVDGSKLAFSPFNLKTKHRVLVLKARSKLERDAWCWALNTEIERLSRRTTGRGRGAQDVG